MRPAATMKERPYENLQAARTWAKACRKRKSLNGMCRRGDRVEG